MRLDRPRLLRRLIAVFTWDSRDADMSEEMRHHIESLAADLERAGRSRDDARLAAQRRFGSVLRLKEAGHDERRPPLVENLVRDGRHMARGLRRSPGFALAVILTLAVGIGGNTTIFSLVDQVLLRPLPYPNGDRLLLVSTRFDSDAPSFVNQSGAPCHCVSPADWLDWQRGNRTLDGIAVWLSNPLTLTGIGEPVRLNNQAVSGEFFHVLGVAPLLGRAITVADDRPNMPRVAVISYRVWQQQFHGDRAVIGRIVQMSGVPTHIIGVMPENFRFIFQDNDVWTSFQLDRTVDWRRRAGRFLDTIARRKAGVTLNAAEWDLGAIQAGLAARYDMDRRTGVNLVPLREELTGQVETSLLVLYGAVAVLLFIACFNAANLLLVRASSRSREIAVRTSLGAGRGSIIRQLLVESLLLALAGGALGVAVAHWSVDALMAFAPPDLLRVPELSVDTRVLFYAVGISLATGLVSGVVPAALVGVRPLAQSLRGGGTTVTHAPRARQLLVAAQVALTVILLCGAGLLSRTLVALTTADQGFDTRDVLTMEVSMPRQSKDEQVLGFFRRAIEALRAIPGVQSVAAANSLAIVGTPRGATGFHRRGTPEVQPGEQPVTVVRVVTPGYFRTLGIPVNRGREFMESDPATAGFVVNQAFVDAFLGGVDAIGAELTVAMQKDNPYLPVIGVVGNVSEGAIRNTAQPTVFYNVATMPEAGMTFLIRTRSAAATTAPAVAAIHRIDPTLAVTKVQTYETALADSVARERLNAMVSAGFAASGLLLAALGLYGLLAFLVSERTKEIAIRITLGAQVRRLTGAVVAGGLRLVLIGAAAGLAGSLVLLRSLRTLLFDVTPYDAPTYGAVLALLCGVATVACYLPARHAARIEPLVALRDE